MEGGHLQIVSGAVGGNAVGTEFIRFDMRKHLLLSGHCGCLAKGHERLEVGEDAVGGADTIQKYSSIVGPLNLIRKSALHGRLALAAPAYADL